MPIDLHVSAWVGGADSMGDQMNTSTCNPCDPVDERHAGGVTANSVAIADPAVLAGLKCEEASIHSREFFIPCGQPAAAIVWHQHDGKHTFLMCAACAWHNVKNRRGRLILTTDRAVLS